MKRSLTCSVIMATYNGSNHIVEQLNSIISQTRKPDEIVICDDSSSDDTVSIVRDFMKAHSDCKIVLFENSSNVGFTKNFINAFNASSFEIVFFSDQDDIWDVHKIEYMMRAFETFSDMDALMCSKIDFHAGQSINSNLINPHYNEKSVSRVSFYSMLKSFNCSGLTLAVRRNEYLRIEDTIINNNNGFDVIAGFYFSAKKSLYSIDYPFVFHRIHDSNATGKPKKRNKEFAIKSLSRKCQWLSASAPLCKGFLSTKEYKDMSKALDYYSKVLFCATNNKKIGLIKNSLFPPKQVKRLYALSNIYYILFK